MVSYTTNFGNSSGKIFRTYGNQGVMDLTDRSALSVDSHVDDPASTQQ